MPIDSSIGDLAWLLQPGDAGTNLAKGASVGAHIAQQRMQNAGLAQRAREFDQQQAVVKQQLALGIAQAPLKQTLLQQDVALRSAQTEQLLYDRQTRVQSEQALGGLAGAVSKALSEATPQDGTPLFFEAVAKNPRIAEDARFQRLWQDYNTSLNAKLALKQATEFTGPELKTIKDEAGNPVTFAREGPNSWKPVQDNTIEVKTPDGTIVRQRTGSGGGAPSFGLQPSVTADVEKKLAANEQSLSLIDQSLEMIAPDTVGPVGAARAGLETAANIIKPGSMDTRATKARQTFRITAQQQYNALKADSQINKVEAAALESIANITSLNESDPTAREKYQTLRDLTALRSVLFNHQLNKFAPDTALKAMSLDQLARAWKRKDITDAEVERWNEIHQLVK